MLDDPQFRPYHDQDRQKARRFLRLVVSLIFLTAIAVAAINLFAYRYMLRDDNQAIVQLLAGWGRLYKPILYDEVRPDVAVFGASWARDAFDPIETGRVLGLTVFNHAVSGGTAYETRRFADSSLDNRQLQSIIVNLDTFYRNELLARMRYGFDESILDIDSAQVPNRFVGLRRTYSLALAGWAVGANIKLISTISARNRGVARADYLRAYERADHTRRQGRMDMARARIFPQQDNNRRSQAGLAPRRVIAIPPELDILLDRMCDHRIDVYAYFTPSHMRQQNCDVQASEELAVLDLLRHKQTSCDARIRYFDFAYPNAMTLEGVLAPVDASEYYRPDGHPRPTVGVLMAARMFERDFPAGTPGVLTRDFGIDLIAHENAEQWLLERAARCGGDWGEGGYAAFADAILTPQ